jgi:hypothetical protein
VTVAVPKLAFLRKLVELLFREFAVEGRIDIDNLPDDKPFYFSDDF